MPGQDYLFEEALLSLDRIKAQELVHALSQQNGAMTTVEKVVAPVLSRIGEGWERGEVALAQVYMSSRLCEELIDQVLPPAAPQRIDQPNMAIAVLEDHHSLGKNIIYSLLRASGYELKDYGHGISVEALVKQVVEDEIEVLLISVLMLRSALRIKNLASELKKQGLNTKIVVGGAPFRFDLELWKEVGATAVGNNGSEAIQMVNRLMQEAGS